MARAVGLQPWRSVALLTVVATCLLAPVGAQQLTPFIGQGVPPPEGVDIYVSVAIDRLMRVLAEKKYTFEVILMLLFTWNDARARPAMEAATAAVAASNGTLPCRMPCDSLWLDTTCCDGVYLPHLELVNAYGMSQDRVIRYAANRTTRRVSLHRSASMLDLYLNNDGDAISGWNIDNISFVSYAVTDEAIMNKSTVSNPDDPFPLHPPAGSTNPRFISYLWDQGFVIIIHISRISDYAVLSIVLPLMLSAILSLLVFAISPRHLDTRLGIVVTLFLSLTALMIVISDMLPESKTVLPTQQLALLGYFFLLFVSLESIWVYYIVRANKNYEIQKRQKRARARFIRRWETMKTMISRDTTEAAAQQAVEGTDQRRGCAPWLRKRRSNTAALKPGDGEVAVPMPERPSTARPPHRLQQSQQLQGPPPPEDDGGELAARRSSVVAFVPMGGVGAGSNSEEGSEFQAPDSELSEYASENENGGDGAAPDWWGRTSSKYQAMWAEIRRNPDYALHVATRIDTGCFWFTCLGYFIASIIILTVDVSFQSTVRL